MLLQCATAATEVKVVSVENPEVSGLPSKPGAEDHRAGVVGQNIAVRASLSARNFLAPFLISTFPVHSTSFVPNPLSTFSLC